MRESHRSKRLTVSMEKPSHYAVLTGDRLRLYSTEPDDLEETSPDHQFIIYRKDGFSILNQTE